MCSKEWQRARKGHSLVCGHTYGAQEGFLLEEGVPDLSHIRYKGISQKNSRSMSQQQKSFQIKKLKRRMGRTVHAQHASLQLEVGMRLQGEEAERLSAN